MKKCFFIPMMVFTGLRAFSQTPQADTNYMNPCYITNVFLDQSALMELL